MIAKEQVRNILLITIAHIGDIVLSCPATRALKQFFPQANIDMLVSIPQGEAAYHNPYLSHVLLYDIADWQQDRTKFLQLITILRQKKYDIALASRHGSANPMLAWLSGAALRIGFDVHGGAKYLTHVVPTRPAAVHHEAESQFELLSALGISANDSHIEFTISTIESAGLYQKLPLLHKTGQPIVLFCPFSEDRQKNWTTSGYSTVLRALTPFADCYLIGSASQCSALHNLNRDAGHAATVLAGTLSLGELGALIQTADLLITVDTGPLHIAQAFSTPVLALMGPTDSNVWGPRKSCDIILQHPLPCAPCWQEESSFPSDCRENQCMRQIQPAEVLQAAIRILQKRSEQS